MASVDLNLGARGFADGLSDRNFTSVYDPKKVSSSVVKSFIYFQLPNLYGRRFLLPRLIDN